MASSRVYAGDPASPHLGTNRPKYLVAARTWLTDPAAAISRVVIHPGHRSPTVSPGALGVSLTSSALLGVGDATPLGRHRLTLDALNSHLDIAHSFRRHPENDPAAAGRSLSTIFCALAVDRLTLFRWQTVRLPSADPSVLY